MEVSVLLGHEWRRSVTVVVMCLVLCMGSGTSKNMIVDTESVQASSQHQLITCWTCPNKTSNSECNGWAPDITCPLEDTVCRTVHRFDSDSESTVLVNKECVAPDMCNGHHVGCQSANNSLKECVTCCSTSYCNSEVAMDNRSARQLSLSVLGAGNPPLTVSMAMMALALLTYPCVT